eukprot:TRINITY_DN12870_c0_g1_i1.p1 TRINITY_DN12870_c0_g1~~TRINITY_DN12870_c0_g1_i1.p1  ORF type:complete len:230 (+),score=42.99 TRINITY_DN12870_c0_g1_i1:101-790(+)
MASLLLFHAANQGDVDQCQVLIIEGCADVNYRNTLGESPVHIAAMRGVSSVLELLLGYGGDPNVQQRQELGGRTPLHAAVERGHIRVVETLLSAHADPNIPDASGQLPLHYAARQGNEAIAELLMCHGSCLDVADNHGKTPAHYAVDRGAQVLVARLPPVDGLSNRPLLRRPDKTFCRRVESDGGGMRWEKVAKPAGWKDPGPVGVEWQPREDPKAKAAGKKKGGKKKK